MILRRLVAGVCLGLISVSYSSAATQRNFRVGAWEVGIYSNDSTGEFSHCTGSATYKSGITVGFSISKNLNWAIVLFKPTWKLSTGTSYDIVFTVDDMPPIPAKAVALS